MVDSTRMTLEGSSGNLTVYGAGTFASSVSGADAYFKNYLGVTGQSPSSAAYIVAKGYNDGDNYAALELATNDNSGRWQFRCDSSKQ